ncbi:FYVE zinc finger-domain-containing protein, partial [Russula earlei]
VRPAASSSSSSSQSQNPIRTRRTSTFRHIPSRSSQTPLVSSPLSPGRDYSRTVSRTIDPNGPQRSHSRLSTVTLPNDTSQPPPTQDMPSGRATTINHPQNNATQPDRRIVTEIVDGHPPAVLLPVPVQKAPSSSPSLTPPASASPVASPSPSSTRTSTPVRQSAPYRPGFQPKGVYRPLTDEFHELRRCRRDVGRVEQTRLERRLEKLIKLHFGEDTDKKAMARPKQPKRMSSIWELDIKSIGPSDLWRGVIQNQVTAGGKADIRAAEQKITPWQNDADFSQCPLCAASFHPITNRKHHCRLCGKVVCSLPVKHPQRPVTCSLLFVSDSKSGQIEEVSEGVDYGVRRRTFSSVGHGTSRDGISPEEKFLRGVRICRECRPALLRKQYAQDRARSPTYSKLYDVFMSLEKEIEDALPQFQELLLTLSSDDHPTADASAARKRLLDAFAQYDALAKRIRALPTSGPGSSQDRVLAAVHTRSNLFLQKHMFPLQSLPRPSKSTSQQASSADVPVIDPDSQLAHALQPLLEQEALLESFIEEAKAHRKFEDAKTLKTNLHEIQAEISKVVANAHDDRFMSAQGDGKSTS